MHGPRNNALHQPLSRARPQKAKQRTVVDNAQTNNVTRVKGVFLQTVIASITKDTPPKPASTKISYGPRPPSWHS